MNRIRQQYPSTSLQSSISSDLDAVSISSSYLEQLQQQQKEAKHVFDDISDVIRAALMITGNTVGAGMMVLPEVAAGPGLGASSAMLLGLYFVNLLSGLLISEVAIKQKESSGNDVPSSFKDFADDNIGGGAGNIIASIAVCMNWCVLSFLLVRGGDLLSSGIISNMVDPSMASIALALGLGAMISSQTNQSLSKIASGAVMMLVLTYGSLVIPGIHHAPLGIVDTFSLPGTFQQELDGNLMESIITTAPFFVQALIFQNIVPTITKMLDYDRIKSVWAIAMGSLIPPMMYVAWMFAVLGGGLDLSGGGGMEEWLLKGFSVAAVTGSAISCAVSTSGEFDSVLSDLWNHDDTSKKESSSKSDVAVNDVASIPSVLFAIIPPLIAGILFSGGEDFKVALSSAGEFGAPLLYGVLPVVLAWSQRNKEQQGQQQLSGFQQQAGINVPKVVKDLVPGGVASLATLGVSSSAFFVHELVGDLSSVVA